MLVNFSMGFPPFAYCPSVSFSFRGVSLLTLSFAVLWQLFSLRVISNSCQPGRELGQHCVTRVTQPAHIPVLHTVTQLKLEAYTLLLPV